VDLQQDAEEDGVTVRRALGYAVALPVSAAAAAILPFVLATGGRVQARDGVLEAQGGVLGPLLRHGNPWFPIAAITLGHVVLSVDARSLETTRAHERVHVGQYERFGFLFPVLYLASSLRAIAAGGRAYRDNAFEKEACARSADTAAA
jgi:hypothetical protein